MPKKQERSSETPVERVFTVAPALTASNIPVAQRSSDEAETVPSAMRSSDSAEPSNETFVVENADEAIKRGGQTFYDYYATYKTLRELAKPLNGLPQSAPLPRGIKIHKITIAFSANGNDRTVEIPEPQKAGDIAGLLGFAIRDVVEKMNNELHVLSYLVSGMHTAVQNAFSAKVMSPPPAAYDNTNTEL